VPFFPGSACQVCLSYCPNARDRPKVVPKTLPPPYGSHCAVEFKSGFGLAGLENELFQPHGLRRVFVASTETPRTPRLPTPPGFSPMRVHQMCPQVTPVSPRPLNAANRWLSLEHSSNGASPEGRLPSAQHRPSAVALRVKPYCFVCHAQETCLTSAVFFNLTNRYCTFSHQLSKVSKVDQTHF
jgi:hypothetical protein